MGGDEFLILRRNARPEETAAGVQKLYEESERAGYSISYGISRQEPAFDLDELLKRADGEMIKFKRDYYSRASAGTAFRTGARSV